MRIQHNIAALNTYRNLRNSNLMMMRSLERLSSGYRINRAGDDAAGLAISEKMRSQITGLTVAERNAMDGLSLIQTAEGALTEVHSMLNRMVEIATQSANGIYDDVDRDSLQEELKALVEEIDRIAESTRFNNKTLLNGDMEKGAIGSIYKRGKYDGSASVGLEFHFGSLYKNDGVKIKLEHTKRTDTSKESDVAEIANDGTLTLKVNANANYTTAEIQDMIHKAAEKENLNVKNPDEYKQALKSVEVFGAGIKGATRKNNNGPGLDPNNGFYKDAAETGKYVINENDLKLQVGDTNDSFNHIHVNIKSMKAVTLGIDLGSISVATEQDAADAIEVINTAINRVSKQRGYLGAAQNRLEHTINNLAVTRENLIASESRIRDVDMAKEMMNYVHASILNQVGNAMLAQANQQFSTVLQMLKAL